MYDERERTTTAGGEELKSGVQEAFLAATSLVKLFPRKWSNQTAGFSNSATPDSFFEFFPQIFPLTFSGVR
jgi:hypothetical protein